MLSGEINLWRYFSFSDPCIKLLSLSGKKSYPQGAEDFSVEAADLTGSIIQSQYLCVTVTVAIIGYLPSAEAWLLWITRKSTEQMNWAVFFKSIHLIPQNVDIVHCIIREYCNAGKDVLSVFSCLPNLTAVKKNIPPLRFVSCTQQFE